MGTAVNNMDLDALDAARSAATPGLWKADKGGWIDAGDYDTVIGPADVDCMAYCYGGRSQIEGDNLAADAALIVAAVNALPDLIAAVRERDALRDAVLALADEWGQDDEHLHPALRYATRSARIRATVRAALGGES